MAQQVAYGERDDVFAGTTPQVARSLLAIAVRKMNKPGTSDCSTTLQRSCIRQKTTSFIVLIPLGSSRLAKDCCRDVHCAERAKHRLRALSSDGWTQSNVFPPRVTVTFLVESLEGLGEVEATPRDFETRRLAVAPGRDSEVRFPKRTIRWVGQKRCFAWSADPDQAEQTIHMCEMDRTGAKGMTSPALKDPRQRDGDEPVNEVEKSWLHSLVGVLYLATNRLDVQYLPKTS